ncbi:MAG: translation elongation factor 4 [Planctomycetota bacterium]
MPVSIAQENIRNFCIVAHIDHGKSTLADRFLLKTGLIDQRTFQMQWLDQMDLERERGITIKASAVRLEYKHTDGKTYLLNLIDTPGHVDFSSEVMRALRACEGALLLVDATQGVEAQTMANAYHAINADLEIIPCINKIDLGTARADEVAEELEAALGFDAADALRCSGKTGVGVDEILAAVVAKIPPPGGSADAPLRALIFDSMYDDYRGVIVYVRVMDGRIKVGQKIRLHHVRQEYEVTGVGVFAPGPTEMPELKAGEVGYFTAGIRGLQDVSVGDTVHDAGVEIDPLPGYSESKPMVYAGFYPSDHNDFEALRKAMQKLRLNDAAFVFEPESSEALGFGFRCGFLGMLHMDIIQERLERESDVDLVVTAPNVTFRVKKRDGTMVDVRSPGDVPDAGLIEEFFEPICKLQVITPAEFIGNVMKLVETRRATYQSQEHFGTKRVVLSYEIPLSEIIFDFFDRLKSATRGYATMEYELKEYRVADLCKVQIMVAQEPVDALSIICHRSVAEKRSRTILVQLRKKIPRHLFLIALQAAIGGKIIARENISPMAKNVLAKCYGGDITRKRKLLEKQKKGKKRMKSVGGVEIPQEAFLSVLNTNEDDE